MLATVAGGGIAGLATSLCLANIGFYVSVIEQTALSVAQVPSGRSINFTLAGRGMRILNRLGVLEEVLARSVLIRKRIIHKGIREFSVSAYGSSSNHCLYSLKRRDLLEILSRACEDHPNIVFIHCTRILDIDFENSKLICQSSQSDSKICSFRDGFLVVADGANSHLCSAMHRSGYSEVSRSKFRWRYTELRLSPDQARQHRLMDHSLHIWQSKNALLVGMPNLDGSYSCNLFLSDQFVPNSCDELLPSHHNALVLSGCPEFLLDTGCEASNQTLKLHTLTTVNMTQWYYRDQIVVLGDACHAVLPFYGQGMNAALEDAFKLAECLVEAQFQREPAFRSFQQRRQSDTRALALLSEQHLESLNSTRSIPRQQSQQLIDTVLTNLFSPIWPHVYELVAQTDLPYKVAQRAASRKAILRTFLGVVIIEELTALVLKFWQRKYDGSISQLKAFLLNQPVLQGDFFRSR